MKLYEFEAKSILKKSGIQIPKGVVTDIYDDACNFFSSNKSAVLKAQILTGGRGKSGGIKFAETISELENGWKKLFNLKIKGFLVRKILIEEKLDIMNEIYLGYSILSSKAKIAFIVSKEGGIDIEELAIHKPTSIIREPIDILEGFKKRRIFEIIKKLGFNQETTKNITEVAFLLYKIFIDYECEIAEINPLAITSDNKVVALDAKIAIYDEAISKYPQFLKEEDTYTELEKEAKKQNLTYVEMDGDIGIIGNGAGLNMATLDILTYFGGRPANFLEVSGRTYHKAEDALRIILSNPKVKVIFGNFFGCISRCDVIARGIASAVKNRVISVPIVVSMKGTGAKEGINTLKKAGLKEIYDDDIIAGERVVKLCQSL